MSIIDKTLHILRSERIRIGLEEEWPVEEEIDLMHFIREQVDDENENSYLKIGTIPETVSKVLISSDRLHSIISDVACVLTKGFEEGEAVVTIDVNTDWNIIQICNKTLLLPEDTEEKVSEVLAKGTFFAAKFMDDILWLAMSRYFIEQHKGRLEIHGSKENGTTISLLLPRLEGS